MLQGDSLQLIAVKVGDDRFSEDYCSAQGLWNRDDDVCPIVQVAMFPRALIKLLSKLGIESRA